MTIKQILKESILQIKCEVVGHDVEEGKEKPLFDGTSQHVTLFDGIDKVYTNCIRCGTPLVLTRDKRPDYFIIAERYWNGGW